MIMVTFLKYVSMFELTLEKEEASGDEMISGGSRRWFVIFPSSSNYTGETTTSNSATFHFSRPLVCQGACRYVTKQW